MEDMNARIREKLSELAQNRKVREKFIAPHLNMGQPIEPVELKEMAKAFYEEEILLAQYDLLLAERFPGKGPWNVEQLHTTIKEYNDKLSRAEEW